MRPVARQGQGQKGQSGVESGKKGQVVVPKVGRGETKFGARGEARVGPGVNQKWDEDGVSPGLR